MWEFTKVFSSSDNLFKFLFVGGVSMIFVALFYPLKQQHELQLKYNEFNLEKALLGNKIQKIKDKVSTLTKLHPSVNNELDSLAAILAKAKTQVEKEKIRKIAFKIEENFKSDRELINKLIEENKVDNIKLSNNAESLLILDGQISTYKTYTSFFWVTGLCIGVLGLLGWIYSTYMTIQLRTLQFQKNKLELHKLSSKEEEIEDKDEKSSTDTPPNIEKEV